MKKILIIAMFCFLGTVVYAQKGEMTVGAQFSLGAGQGLVNPGLGAKFSYSITDPWRLGASFDYGFKNKSTSVWDINIDAHYQFFFGKGFRVYPLLGFTIVGYHSGVGASQRAALDAAIREGLDGLGIYDQIGFPDISINNTCFGVNIGAGFQYDINDQWGVYTEVKGQCVSNHGSRFVWTVGGCFKF
ncbi:MAG: outer membrane beta-barrel protein [Bacteroidales bacterium]